MGYATGICWLLWQIYEKNLYDLEILPLVQEMILE